MRKVTIIKIALILILMPIMLVVLAAVALYLPPVQQWAVEKACAYASEVTGMDVGIGKVHLSFPLDLSLQGVHCMQQNDSLPQVTDTIANVSRVIAAVELLPLLDGNIHVNALELNQVHLNTADLVHKCRVKGYVGRLMIDNDDADKTVASVALESSVANVSSVILDDAHLNIEVSDTVPKDTTKSVNKWKIYVDDLRISNSTVTVHLPGDTLKIGATLKDVQAKGGYFDLGKGWYDINHLNLAKSAFSFDNNYKPHSPNGLDYNHITLSNISLGADSIHYWAPDTLTGRKTAIACLIRHATLQESSGITLKSLQAAVKIDSSSLKVDGTLATPSSMLAINLNVKPNVIDTLDLGHGRIEARINASIGRQDLMTAFCTSAKTASDIMPSMLRKSWPMYPLAIKGEMHGNLNEVSIPWMTVSLPTAFSLDARGAARGFMSLTKNVFSRKFSAKLHCDLKTYNMAFMKTMLDKSTQKNINIPSLHAIADITANGPDYDISLKAQEGRGNVTAKGHINASAMSYIANAKATRLDLGHFVKGYGLSSFTGTLIANGNGTDIKSKSTKIASKASIQQFQYAGYDLSNINAGILLRNGKISANIDAHNRLLEGQIAMNGIIDSRHADITMMTDLSKADLYHLKVAKTPLTITMCCHLDIATDMKQYYKVQGMVSDIGIEDTVKTYHPDDIIVDLLTRRDTTAAKIDCGDFALKMNAQGGYKWLLGCTGRMKEVVTRHFRERTINQDDIRLNLPLMTMSLQSGRENPIYRFAKYFGVDFNYINLNMKTSREDGIFADLNLSKLATKGYNIDTVTVNISSTNEPKEIYYNAHIQNLPPNDIVFDAYLDGKLLTHGISVNTKLYDDKNKLALLLGAEATMEERGIRMHLTPENPVLGYEEFTLNDDNFLLLAHNNRIHALVNLNTSDGTGIKIYCTDNDSENIDENDNVEATVDNYLQDLTLSINKLDLGRVVASLPYTPNVKGLLNGDFHLMQNEDLSFQISSDMGVDNMIYEDCAIGNLGTQFTYLPKGDGSHYVDGIITLNDKEIGTLTGSYTPTSDIIDATMKMEIFPMGIINGFIPQQILGLEGTAEGDLSIQGTSSKPIVNGELYLQDAALLSVPYGIRLRFDDDPVTISNSSLKLENFEMYAPNNQPLVTYGTIDFANTNHINVNMRMKADDFQLINSKENLRSEAYGNVYVNCLAFIKGEVNDLQMYGKLEVLPTTDLYYILRDSPITTDNTMKDLVTFTDLTDSTDIKKVKPQVEGMTMSMNVVVDQGAHIKAWLDASHNNYVDIIGNGDLRMTYKNEQMGMTGRYTITEGEMKYSLPVIPLKTFTIQDGSYLEWTGEMMNPRLNITALESVKSNVNINDVNQMVTFNTGVKLSKTLNDMGLEFLIESPENKDIADELSMRSQEERGKLAVTLLTTGMYLSDGNTKNFSMNSAMNSFLQAQINNIAGSALKTIDLSFGMESSTEQDGTRHNDYTFKFAKRFWSNRLSISVGGKISSGPDVSGQNRSFFNNVELQYHLSQTSNKYLQMFYKKDVYDYLEGYISQYGAGFLWKKNSQTILDLFRNEKKQTINFEPENKDSMKR